jgi:Mitochondrial carrier protein
MSQDAQDVLSATFGGIVTAFFASPVELVMIQQQIYGGSIASTVKSIVVQNGVFARSGLMRGLLPTIGRDSIYTVGMLGVVPVLQDRMVRDAGISVTAAGFYASVLGGTAAALFSHPLDIVKTNMQGDCLFVAGPGRLLDSHSAATVTASETVTGTVSPSNSASSSPTTCPDGKPRPRSRVAVAAGGPRSAGVVKSGVGKGVGLGGSELRRASEVFKKLWKEGGLKRLYAGSFWRVSIAYGAAHVCCLCVVCTPFTFDH